MTTVTDAARASLADHDSHCFVLLHARTLRLTRPHPFAPSRRCDQFVAAYVVSPRAPIAVAFHGPTSGFYFWSLLYPRLLALRARYRRAGGRLVTATVLREPRSQLLSLYRMWPPTQIHTDRSVANPSTQSRTLPARRVAVRRELLPLTTWLRGDWTARAAVASGSWYHRMGYQATRLTWDVPIYSRAPPPDAHEAWKRFLTHGPHVAASGALPSAPRGDGCRAEFAYTRLMDAFDLVCATEGSAHGGGEVLQAFIDQLSAAARLPTRPIGHRTPGARARGGEGVRARARRAVELAPADVSTRAALAEAAACDESLYNLSLQVGAVRRCSWLGRPAQPQPAPTPR